jgi:hypothetical protein
MLRCELRSLSQVQDRKLLVKLIQKRQFLLDPIQKKYREMKKLGKLIIQPKLHMGNTGFSLFHFGGLVALSTECKSNVMPRKEGMIGDFSQEYPTDHVESDHASNKKESTMEEYKYLFAASNGIKFSFF